jgi:hypothetical protein
MSSWSNYNYCFNNPINYTDPTGMAPVNDDDKVAATVNVAEDGSAATATGKGGVESKAIKPLTPPSPAPPSPAPEATSKKSNSPTATYLEKTSYSITDNILNHHLKFDFTSTFSFHQNESKSSLEVIKDNNHPNAPLMIPNSVGKPGIKIEYKINNREGQSLVRILIKIDSEGTGYESCHDCTYNKYDILMYKDIYLKYEKNVDGNKIFFYIDIEETDWAGGTSSYPVKRIKKEGVATSIADNASEKTHGVSLPVMFIIRGITAIEATNDLIPSKGRN